MTEVLLKFLTILGGSGLCYIAWLGLKFVVTLLICKHPELSDDKVKYITRMITKDKHQSQ